MLTVVREKFEYGRVEGPHAEDGPLGQGHVRHAGEDEVADAAPLLDADGKVLERVAGAAAAREPPQLRDEAEEGLLEEGRQLPVDLLGSDSIDIVFVPESGPEPVPSHV